MASIAGVGELENLMDSLAAIRGLRQVRRVLQVLVLIACVRPASAQVDPQSEHKFKAVYLYNFLKFVDWPNGAFADQSSPVRIGILGNDQLTKLLGETVGSEKIGDRSVVVAQISTLNEVQECQMVFVSRTEKDRYREILTKVKGKPILSVGEEEEFFQMGGAVNFYFEGKRLRFEINLKSVKAAELTANSKLLRLAKIVGSVD